MALRFTIDGRLSGTNEYINACRSNKYAGAEMKKRNQRIVKDSVFDMIVNKQLKAPRNFPVKFKIDYYEKDERRDADNVMFGVKFILDSLVNMYILPDDSRKYVNAIESNVYTDRKNPRIEVEVIENGKR